MNTDIRDRIREARLAQAEGRSGEARAAYLAAAELARADGEAEREAFALRHVSDIDRESGRLAEAVSEAERAVELYEAGAGTPLDLANAHRLAALAHEAAGDRETAIIHWRRAALGYDRAGVEEGFDECTRRLGN